MLNYKKLRALFCSAFIMAAFANVQLSAHCQMPCGIYHDDMVYDLIDQYVETMYKGISVLNNSKFSNAKERNEFVRWVMEKDQSSDQTAKLINEYFLQQKIKAGEDDTTKRLVSAHKLLLLLMSIKQNVDIQLVQAFSKEWDQFKLMFHREDYACEMEKAKLGQEASKRKQHSHDHHHDHDHDHEHTAAN